MSRSSETLSDHSQLSATIINDDYCFCEQYTCTGADDQSSNTPPVYKATDRSDAFNTGEFFSRNLLLNELWGGHSHKTSVIYENLCTGCGYGVFEAKGKLCNFCQFVVNGCFQRTDDNIYENICVKCGEIYSGKECDICNNNNEKIPTKNNKKSKKSTRILSGIFETLKRVKSRDKTTKPRKLEIIHNVDGYSNVFKTNETFDLNRICELKRLQSSSDQHIYGKLRRCDNENDHLITSLESPINKSLQVNSKSDPALHKIVNKTTQQTSAIPEIRSVNKPASSYTSQPDKKIYTFYQNRSVIEWMTSLRCQTFDYNNSPWSAMPDDSICNTKSIPSRNFSCCGFVHEYGSSEFLSGEESTLRSLFTNDQDCTQMVDDFKRNLMAKQRAKRRAIYLKVDEPESVDIDSTTTASSTFDNLSSTSLRRSCRRYGFYEKNSDFVNDLLSAFDSFLSSDNSRDHENDPLSTEVAGDSVIAISGNPTTPQQQSLVQEPAVIEFYCQHHPRSDIIHGIENRGIECCASSSEIVIAKHIDLKRIINFLIISQSLNRIVITYDRNLSVFLSVINTRSFGSCEFSQLFKIFLKISSNLALRRLPKKKKQKINKISDRAVPPPYIASMTVQPRDEDIYQPIWKFKTVGNPRESYGSDYYDITIHDSSRVEDHGEWETDDEFMFSTKMKEVTNDGDEISITTTTTIASSTSTSGKINSENSLYGGGGGSSGGSSYIARTDPYQNVCIFYSQAEPKLRAIVYNYDPRCSYFTSQQSHSNYSHVSRSVGCETRISPEEMPLQVPFKVKTIRPSRESVRIATIPDCVQAWKFMLLDINYLDDEEDMYISEDEILKLKQIESESVPVATLQRFKSVSSDNLLDLPQDKKSIGERFRNKLQRGVLKLNSRQPKEKKGKGFSKRSDTTSLYLEDGIKPKYPIFGAPLHSVEMDPVELTVPRFVVDCINYIQQKESIQIDGLYRASGNKVAIDELKLKLTESYIYDSRLLRTEDIHTITGLLKLFFRELQTPLIPQEFYRKLPESLVESSNLSVIKKTLLEIPNPSLGTLKFLLKHLTVVAHYSVENRMPASNLAIIWGPCLLYSSSMGPFEIARMNTLTKVLIENYDTIFGDNERLVN